MRSLPNVQLTSQLEGDIWSVRSGSECSELGLQSRGRAPRTQTKGELQHQLPQPAPGYRLLPAALFIDSVGCLLSPSVCQAQPDHQPSSSSHSFPQTNGSSCGMKSNVFPTAQLLLVWSREGSGAGHIWRRLGPPPLGAAFQPFARLSAADTSAREGSQFLSGR